MSTFAWGAEQRRRIARYAEAMEDAYASSHDTVGVAVDFLTGELTQLFGADGTPANDKDGAERAPYAADVATRLVRDVLHTLDAYREGVAEAEARLADGAEPERVSRVMRERALFTAMLGLDDAQRTAFLRTYRAAQHQAASAVAASVGPVDDVHEDAAAQEADLALEGDAPDCAAALVADALADESLDDLVLAEEVRLLATVVNEGTAYEEVLEASRERSYDRAYRLFLTCAIVVELEAARADGEPPVDATLVSITVNRLVDECRMAAELYPYAAKAEDAAPDFATTVDAAPSVAATVDAADDARADAVSTERLIHERAVAIAAGVSRALGVALAGLVFAAEVVISVAFMVTLGGVDPVIIACGLLWGFMTVAITLEECMSFGDMARYFEDKVSDRMQRTGGLVMRLADRLARRTMRAEAYGADGSATAFATVPVNA